jgi:protein-S-isoprenylcysteine O-methyltransferase Ste14
MTREDGDSRSRFFPPAITIVSVLAGVGLQYLLPLRLPAVPVVHWIGWTLIVAWLVLAVWAVREFRRAGTTPNPTGEVTAFVATGPFRLSRNPMYLGLLIFQVGAASVLGNGWILVLTLPSFVLLDRLVIAGEERYLAARYGADFDAYCRRVRRWL